MNSGIYIVQLLNEDLMPVTRDSRYMNICAKVNKHNIKVGKALDFNLRFKTYIKDFDQHNVVFEPIERLVDIKVAEKVILRELSHYHISSPKGGKLEWLAGISYENVKDRIILTLRKEEIKHTII